jgi:hypothetical protein
VRIKETPAAQVFPATLTNVDADFSRTFRIGWRRDAMLPQGARCIRQHCPVNTSLSGTLFF